MKKSIIALIVIGIIVAAVILLDGCASNSLHYMVSDFVNG